NSITSTHSILTSYDKRPESSECPPSEWTLMTRSMKYCSRFESCPVMKCPLDPQINGRMPYDPELDGEFKDSVCTMAKATRHRYWKAMPEDLREALPYQGFFEGEYRRIIKAKERWESLTEDQRSAVRDRMKAIREEKMK
ncbi:MAG: hypothetical protein AAE976_05340, partial [Thermoplasmataceae archaeon]